MAYINGIGTISIQAHEEWMAPDISETKHIRCQEPDFSAYIPPMVARRMSKIIKRAVVSSKMALTDANIEMPDAIVSGTGLGCVEDTEKFLTAMIQNHETLLQPTHFIQSTHNTISSQIAMQLKCYGYNNTYSHLGISFESALLDAFLQIKTGACAHVLVGGYDEMTPNYFRMLSKLDFWEHCFAGEGCTSLVVSNQKTPNTYCKIEAIHLFYNLNNQSAIEEEVAHLLKTAAINLEDIDYVMTGTNNDPDNDTVYHAIYSNLIHLPQLSYKLLSGEYFTASAYGVALAAKLLKTQKVPENISKNNNTEFSARRILFHQHFHNQAHALILLSLC